MPLIVIPRSFSSARLSMRRSREGVCPPCVMSVSSSVVLPWSTCAMIAKLRTRLVWDEEDGRSSEDASDAAIDDAPNRRGSRERAAAVAGTGASEGGAGAPRRAIAVAERTAPNRAPHPRRSAIATERNDAVTPATPTSARRRRREPIDSRGRPTPKRGRAIWRA